MLVQLSTCVQARHIEIYLYCGNAHSWWVGFLVNVKYFWEEWPQREEGGLPNVVTCYLWYPLASQAKASLTMRWPTTNVQNDTSQATTSFGRPYLPNHILKLANTDSRGKLAIYSDGSIPNTDEHCNPVITRTNRVSWFTSAFVQRFIGIT